MARTTVHDDVTTLGHPENARRVDVRKHDLAYKLPRSDLRCNRCVQTQVRIHP